MIGNSWTRVRTPFPFIDMCIELPHLLFIPSPYPYILVWMGSYPPYLQHQQKLSCACQHPPYLHVIRDQFLTTLNHAHPSHLKLHLRWFFQVIFGQTFSNLRMLLNNRVLCYISLSDKEEIDPVDADGELHLCLVFFRIILRRTLLLALVEDAWAGFFSSPSDLLSLPANWNRALATAALIIFSVDLFSVLILLFEFPWSCFLIFPQFF